MDPIQEGNTEPIKRSAPGLRAAHLRLDKENQRLVGLEGEKVCHGCRESMIKSRHLINLAGQQQHWHPECFKCAVCQLILAHEDSCHVYREKIICRDDYVKLQRETSTKCTRCKWPVAASDWVRRAGEHVYHLACFTCDLCMRQLSTGEQFTLSSQVNSSESTKLICRLHFAIDREQPEAGHAGSSGHASPSATTSISVEPAYNSNTCQHQTDLPDRSKFSADQYIHFLVASQSAGSSVTGQQQQSDHQGCVLDNSLDESQCLEDLDTLEPIGGASACSSNGSRNTVAISAAGAVGGGSSKSKRVRTTFTEDQLSILQTHFQIDSNPDGQDLERIATITGLSKRVTQVWFQNSRARQKKYMIKRKPMAIGSSAAGSSGCATTTSLTTTDQNTPSQFATNQVSQPISSCQSIRWVSEAASSQFGNLQQPTTDLSYSKGHEKSYLALSSQQHNDSSMLEVDLDEIEGEDEEGDDDDDGEDDDDEEEEEVGQYNRKQEFRN